MTWSARWCGGWPPATTPSSRSSTPKSASWRVLAKQPGAADAYVATSYRLSRLLADGCGNQRLAEIMATLARQTRRYSQLGLQTAARRKASARLWRATLDALKAGEMNAAATAIESLIDASRQEAVKAVAGGLAAPTLTKDIVQ